MPLVEFVGGPHDGLVANKRGLPFLWVDAKGRAYAARRDGRSLYRAAETREMFALGTVRQYRYAQLSHVQCDGCGCIHERVPICTLCGSSLAGGLSSAQDEQERRRRSGRQSERGKG